MTLWCGNNSSLHSFADGGTQVAPVPIRPPQNTPPTQPPVYQTYPTNPPPKVTYPTRVPVYQTYPTNPPTKVTAPTQPTVYQTYPTNPPTKVTYPTQAQTYPTRPPTRPTRPTRPTAPPTVPQDTTKRPEPCKQSTTTYNSGTRLCAGSLLDQNIIFNSVEQIGGVEPVSNLSSFYN